MRRLYYKGENLYIKGEKRDGILILYLEGVLDAHVYHHLEEIFERAIKEGTTKFIIECSKLQYICSAAVGLFIGYIGGLKEKEGKIIFVGVSDNVEMVFSLLNIKDMFEFTDKSIEEVVTCLK